MLPVKPYMVKAIYQWLVDNDWTPYLLANVLVTGVQVPQEHVRDNRIVLNVSPASVRHLNLDNDGVSFEARFSGRAQMIWVPMAAVEAVYAKENGEGMSFEVDLSAEPAPRSDVDDSQSVTVTPLSKGNHLKVVK